MKATYNRILQGDALNRLEMKKLVSAFFEPTADPDLIAAILMALHDRKETAEELAGSVDALMERAVPYPEVDLDLLDMCGTGGDQSGSFNISTTAAFVVAACDVHVAKHGNRSISSRSGSADVLAALGLDISLSPEKSAEQLRSNSLTFLFAPDVHPAMKQIQPIRKALGRPTLFNLIGPLANPYTLRHQLIGVYKAEYQEVLAQAAKLLGRRRVVIVTGEGQLDEASLDGTTTYTMLHENEITTHQFTAQDVAMPAHPRSSIAGGEAEDNAAILRQVLSGESSAYLDTTLVNAGLALLAAETVGSIQEGIAKARLAIESGAALIQLTTYPTRTEVTS